METLFNGFYGFEIVVCVIKTMKYTLIKQILHICLAIIIYLYII